MRTNDLQAVILSKIDRFLDQTDLCVSLAEQKKPKQQQAMQLENFILCAISIAGSIFPLPNSNDCIALVQFL